VGSTNSLAPVSKTTRRHIQKKSNFNVHRRENLKYDTNLFSLHLHALLSNILFNIVKISPGPTDGNWTAEGKPMNLLTSKTSWAVCKYSRNIASWMARHSRRGSSNWVHSGSKWAKLHLFWLNIYMQMGRTYVNLETSKTVLSSPVNCCLSSPAQSSQGQNYFTTVGLLLISSSWCQAPWGSHLSTTYKASARTSQETLHISATNTNRLTLFTEITAVYCENHTKHTNTLWAECRVLVR
jgi:hypothetical protein